jgi:hypothetical protein
MRRQALDSHNSAGILFVNYGKASVTVITQQFLRKTAFDIQLPLLKWMHSFLLNRQQRVKICDYFARLATPDSGVPQEI